MDRFMDAEIGIRDLADTFRYNVLPEVIEAIGCEVKSATFEDLPDYKKLLWMVRS
jgi:nitric oxide synthase oxygenase domain/subunit